MISLFVVSGVVQERAVALAGIEQYIAALNLCFLIYGDPRGRGAHGTPIMLFICWRTGIISRAMDRILDAELADEIFDATLFSLESQQITEYQNLYKCYSDFQFMPPKISKPSEIDISNYAAKMYISDTDEEVGQVYRTSKCLGHPFSHWTVHRHFIKSVESNKSVSSLVQMSLIRNKGLEEWLLNNLPLASKRSTPVLTESIQYSASISVAVFTQHLERLEKQAGYQSPSARLEEAVNPLCRLISRERFALNCVNLEGACYSWGSNNMGQLGSVASAEEPSPLINTRPFLLYNPRPLLSLKDILIREVACGYSHTLAIAESGVLLAWGSNRHFQLGIGPDYPDTVMSAVPVKIAVAVRSVSCGSEHSLALTHDGQVYSWGQGEGGLLGLDHFDSCHTPQHVMAMSHVAVDSIVCGGLHNLALTDRGQLWSWGRGEGGQLGVKRELLIQTKDGELYQNKPYLIEAFSRTRVTQIAAGDAHSLALEIGGLAYAWGFSTSGQLGTGAFSHDHSLTGPGTQQFEPALVKLPQDKPIMKIFAGKTFSFFQNCNNEIYACGSNHFSQIGLPSRVTLMRGKYTDQMEIPVPIKVSAFDFSVVNNVASGPNHCVAACTMANRSVTLAWGSQRHAQLGLPITKNTHTLPQILHQFNDVPISSISCGGYHSVIVIGKDQSDNPGEKNSYKKASKFVTSFWEEFGD